MSTHSPVIKGQPVLSVGKLMKTFGVAYSRPNGQLMLTYTELITYTENHIQFSLFSRPVKLALAAGFAAA